MAKVTVEGLKEQSGEMGFVPWEPGVYTIQYTQAPEIKDSRNKDCTIYQFRGTIIDCAEGLEDQPSGRSPLDSTFVHSIPVLKPEHVSYEQWGYIGKNELKSLLVNADIPLKGNSFDPDDFIGKTVKVQLSIEESSEEGRDPQNRVKKYMPDEG